jgi:hypothetical protein
MRKFAKKKKKKTLAGTLLKVTENYEPWNWPLFFPIKRLQKVLYTHGVASQKKSKFFQCLESESMIAELCPNFMCQPKKLLKILLHCNGNIELFWGAFVLLLQYPIFQDGHEWLRVFFKGLHGIHVSTQPSDPTSCFNLMATVAVWTFNI